MLSKEWILCPICGNKTRVRIRKDTELKNFPLYCPKCSRNAGMVGGKVMTDQIEGGQEIQQASMIMCEASSPVTGTASRGAELFKSQVINRQKA